jgi:lipopolysaccharide/colanic/teichoic acid biosynthesis glycosyltransferase
MKESLIKTGAPGTWALPAEPLGYPGKRAFDLILALLLLPLLAPVIALLWLLVRLDGGPGFYGHSRVGRNGTPFRCWKLRSMCVSAEARLAAHLAQNPAAAAEWARDFKLTEDPRITRLGRILRKTSLDELPQIWNVLRGEMSLVGLRPITEAELTKYGPHQGLYLALRPGITGPWQVEGRGNRVSYADRVQLDLSYGQNLSLAHDLNLIARTITVLLNPKGV